MSLPERLPMFPLSAVLFPHTRIPLHVFEPRYRALVEECRAGDPRLGIVLISRGSEVGGGDERFDVGTLARLETARPLPGGRWSIEVSGLERIRVRAWHDDRPYPVATVEEWPAPALPTRPEMLDEAGAAVRRAWALLSELGDTPTAARAMGATPSGGSNGPDDPPGAPSEAGVWRLCATAPLGALDRQRLLAAPGADERIVELTALVDAVARDARALLGGA